jgi:tRNA wybutosine-synthesizing protein 2
MLQPIKQLLIENLKDDLTQEHLELLPSSYQKIGDIVIINLDIDLIPFEDEIGKIILKNIPNTRTVCSRTGEITGEERLPQLEVIAGVDNTETIHKENGCLYSLDVAKIMFAKGNLKERGRLTKLVKPNEIIVDLFAGIGYFSIPIAKFARPSKIYAIDINPTSILYLQKNIQLNRVEGKIEVILGDCREVVKKLGRIANRLIMGYLPNTKEFLDSAFTVLKQNGGIIHYHDVFKEENLWDEPLGILKASAEKNGYVLEKLLEKRIVKSYAPKVVHVVIDAKFSKRK